MMGIWKRMQFIGRSYLSDIMQKGKSYIPYSGSEQDDLDAEWEKLKEEEAKYERLKTEFEREKRRVPKEVKNAYESLGVTESASDADVKKAFKDMMKKYHPDRYTDENKKVHATKVAQTVTESYQIIKKYREKS